MNQRRDKVLITLIIYLESGIVPKSNELFTCVTKTVEKSLAENIMQRIHPTLKSNQGKDDAIEDDSLVFSETDPNFVRPENDLQMKLPTCGNFINYYTSRYVRFRYFWKVPVVKIKKGF